MDTQGAEEDAECPKCGKGEPEVTFARKGGCCRDCRKAYNREWYAREKESARRYSLPGRGRYVSTTKKILRARSPASPITTVYRMDGDYFHDRCNTPLWFRGENAIGEEQWYCRLCCESVFILPSMKPDIPEKGKRAAWSFFACYSYHGAAGEA